MPTFRPKQKEIKAVQHKGTGSLVVVGVKGEQRANPGDFILIHGDRPEDREVLSNKEFREKYDELDESGNVIEAKAETPGDVYNVQHFDTIEQAQAAAALHYTPKEAVEGDKATENVVATPFHCTIGATDHVYSIAPNGVVNQVPVVMRDSTSDLGAPAPEGAVSDKVPAPLDLQGGSVHDDVGPMNNFQESAGEAEDYNGGVQNASNVAPADALQTPNSATGNNTVAEDQKLGKKSKK